MTAKKNYTKRIPGQDDIVSFEYVTPEPLPPRRPKEDSALDFLWCRNIQVSCKILRFTNGITNNANSSPHEKWHYMIKPPKSDNWIILYSSSLRDSVVDWAAERHLPIMVKNETIFTE